MRRIRSRHVITIGSLVVVAGIAALIFLAPFDTSPVSGFVKAGNQPLFPEVHQRIDDVRTIEVRSAEARYTLRNDRDVWRIVQRDGYPVDAPAVEALIRELSDLKALYVSERDEPDYAEYGLVKPSNEQNRAKSATEVMIRDSDERVLGHAIIGPSFSVPGHGADKKVFLRRGGDGRIWLADSDLTVAEQPFDWIDRHVVNVPHQSVTEVATVAPNGQELVIARKDDGTLRIAKGRAQAPTTGRELNLENMTAVLESVQAEDVSSVERIKNGWKSVGESRVRTADGVTYQVRLYEHAEAVWAQMTAEASGAEPEAETARRIQAFNDDHSRWVYRLPPFTAEKLTTRPRDLIERF